MIQHLFGGRKHCGTGHSLFIQDSMQPHAVLHDSNTDANEYEERPNAAQDNHTYRGTIEKSYGHQRLNSGGQVAYHVQSGISSSACATVLPRVKKSSNVDILPQYMMNNRKGEETRRQEQPTSLRLISLPLFFGHCLCCTDALFRATQCDCGALMVAHVLHAVTRPSCRGSAS